MPFHKKLFQGISDTVYDLTSPVLKPLLDPIKKEGQKGIEKIGRGIGESFTNGVKAAKDRNIQQAEEDLLSRTLDSANFESNQSPALSGASELRGSLGNRLESLRAGRDASVEAIAQPRLQQISDQAGLAERRVSGEGSRQFSQRAEIGTDQALASQQVQAQSLGQELSTEQGVQQLETQIEGFFNEMAANRFTREMSGLTENMNKWLSDKGAQIGYDQLALEARRNSMEMFGRFTSALGTEIARGGGNKPNTPAAGYENPAAAGDAFMPAYQRKF